MTLAASAWRMRQAARHALAAGDPARARTLASQAEQICHTPAGRRLHALSAWLINRAATVREPVADESNFAC
jgi:Co/Zn/Cd efflux system component